jgi:hypothetical protein
MHTKDVTLFGKPATVACDGNCQKAWGISARPKLRLGVDDDDVVWLADGELGEAPADPGTYEGGFAKPTGPHEMNKWCTRQCERSTVEVKGKALTPPDYSRRVFNQPWKHKTSNP